MAKAISPTVRRVDISQPNMKKFLSGTFSRMARAVRAGGCWTQSDLTAKKFPISQQQTVPAKVVTVQFKRDIEFDEVVELLTKQGLILGRIEHMWLLAAYQPRLQLNHCIAAPGSVWYKIKNEPYIPHLRAWGKERQAYIRYTGLGWDYRWLFLAFEPLSAPAI